MNMKKRIEIKEDWRKRIIDAENINHFSVSFFDDKVLFEIGVHQFQVSMKGLNQSIARAQSEQFTEDLENFICNKTEANKMIIEIGEFKELVSKGYADVTIVVYSDSKSTFKVDDEQINVEASCTTTHFKVRINDIDNLSDEEVIEKAKKKLLSAIGNKNIDIDDSWVERTKNVYNVSCIRVSYE